MRNLLLSGRYHQAVHILVKEVVKQLVVRGAEETSMRCGLWPRTVKSNNIGAPLFPRVEDRGSGPDGERYNNVPQSTGEYGRVRASMAEFKTSPRML